MSLKKKIGWGIIGPGKIANHFVKDLQKVSGAIVAAVASRNLERATKFAKEYKVTSAYGNYESLFKDPKVDVVYIATPHTTHKELSILAMQHGKHVLCEKPMGINKAEVAAVLKVAKENKVFFMEALWTRFNPAIKKVKELINNEAIGKLSYLHADFAFYGLDRSPESRVLNTELAGGSLLDIGIYPVFLAYLLMGLPKKVLATANFNATGTEIQTSIIFSYNTSQAVLYSGLSSNSEVKAQIQGENGTIIIDGRWHEAEGFTIEKEGVLKEVKLPTIGRGYFYEIEEVHKCIEERKIESPLWSHQNSLDLIGLLDLVREKAGIKFPFHD